jgi:hypothetical protein
VAGFALGEQGGVKRFFTGRAIHFGAVTAVSTVALVAVLGVGNWVAYKRPKSWDLTKGRIFTLQEDTVRSLKNLKVDVCAIAVYRLDEEGYAQAEGLLERYAALSPRFTYEMVDPYRSPEKARTYGVASGGPRILLVAGAQKAPASFADEQGLTNALVKVTRSGSRKVYFTSGHGEPDPSSQDPRGYGQISKALSAEGYEVAALPLMEKAEVPDDASVVIVAGARNRLFEAEAKARAALRGQGGHRRLPRAGVDNGPDALLQEWRPGRRRRGGRPGAGGADPRLAGLAHRHALRLPLPSRRARRHGAHPPTALAGRAHRVLRAAHPPRALHPRGLGRDRRRGRLQARRRPP